MRLVKPMTIAPGTISVNQNAAVTCRKKSTVQRPPENVTSANNAAVAWWWWKRRAAAPVVVAASSPSPYAAPAPVAKGPSALEKLAALFNPAPKPDAAAAPAAEVTPPEEKNTFEGYKDADLNKAYESTYEKNLQAYYAKHGKAPPPKVTQNWLTAWFKSWSKTHQPDVGAANTAPTVSAPPPMAPRPRPA